MSTETALRRAPPYHHHHNNLAGEVCSGDLEFLKNSDVPIPDTRRCVTCGRVESYERGALIVVGQEDVGSKTLVDFCKKLQSHVLKNRPKHEHQSYLSTNITIGTDKSNPKVRVAIVLLPDVERMRNPEMLLLEIGGYEEAVKTAYRKPKVIYDLPKK